MKQKFKKGDLVLRYHVLDHYILIGLVLVSTKEKYRIYWLLDSDDNYQCRANLMGQIGTYDPSVSERWKRLTSDSLKEFRTLWNS